MKLRSDQQLCNSLQIPLMFPASSRDVNQIRRQLTQTDENGSGVAHVRHGL